MSIPEEPLTPEDEAAILQTLVVDEPEERKQVHLNMNKSLLDQIEVAAKGMRISKAAYISLACHHAVTRGILKD